MPEKTRAERARRARKEGKTLILKEDDVGQALGKSTHAVKKSRHNAREVTPPRRHASRRNAPGEGNTARAVGESGRAPGRGGARRDRPMPLDFVDAAQGRALRSGTLKRKPQPKANRRVTNLRGRKKAPSELGVKRAGGPRKRLPIHGG